MNIANVGFVHCSLFTHLHYQKLVTKWLPLACYFAYDIYAMAFVFYCTFFELDMFAIYRDYFMVGECVRFLFTSCEGLLNERVSAANE